MRTMINSKNGGGRELLTTETLGLINDNSAKIISLGKRLLEVCLGCVTFMDIMDTMDIMDSVDLEREN
jgi:hypothetical protein